MLTKIAKILFLLGVILILISYLPSFFYTLAGKTKAISSYLFETASGAKEETLKAPKKEYQPPFDSQLPIENRLKITSIGVDTLINEATYDNYEGALKKGVWRVSSFGTPFGREKPTILAAHRFGYLKWSNLFRRKNSFYNLLKLKNGETVEIIWRQRKYTYAVYSESEGDKIEDYTADLILYTCRDLTSDLRIFKYARLLEI